MTDVAETPGRLPPGWSLTRLGEVPSTNDLAKQWTLDPAGRPGLPRVIRADRQTRGRGRGSNAWWSDSGSLTLSVVLDPESLGLEARHTPLSSLATAVAVIKAVRPWVGRGSLALRWPNDVEIDRRKIAGILPERINSPDGPRLIIGIGLNVRSRLDNAPPEVRSMAASLDEFSDTPITDDDQETIFTSLLRQLREALALLAQDDPGLAREWVALDQLAGTPVRLDLGAEIVEGIGQGIGPDGGLRLSGAGFERTYYGGRVLR